MSGERVAQMHNVSRRGRLATRFGWSSPTAGKFITALLDKRQGHIRRVTYKVRPLAADKLARSTRTTVKKPGTGMPGYGSRDNGSGGDLHTLKGPPTRTTCGGPTLHTHEARQHTLPRVYAPRERQARLTKLVALRRDAVGFRSR